MATCFVVQGFGEKPDLATGRTLNLDASYEVIKEAVVEAGLECIRADEIVHSGSIDKQMYDALYKADLVIADLSTSNLNAAYELGVRYGLKRRATIIVAEEQFKNPFDFSHIVIRRYEHLGKDIGRREATKFKNALVSAIKDIVAKEETDSPVYTYLQLQPPGVAAAAVAAAAPARVAPGPVAAPSPAPAAAVTAAPRPEPSKISTGELNAKLLLEAARLAMSRNDFAGAKALFAAVHAMRPNDTYVVQQHALATYKSKLPDARAALEEAQTQLRGLDPDTTNDPETLGLWGAVHKRMWDLTQDRAQLDVAISAYERGFYLKQDYYTGINYAFLLNVRAAVEEQAGERADAVTDFVLARRVRKETMRYCEKALVLPMADTDRFWVIATLWEAAVGLQDEAVEKKWAEEAAKIGVAPWMTESTQGQLERLRTLLAASQMSTLYRKA
jgi:tetratricopeptide (TPR) repeat protein